MNEQNRHNDLPPQDLPVSPGTAWALIQDGADLFFIRRSFYIGRGGQWCPPGGAIRENEWPEVACIRKVFEETRFRVSILSELARFGNAHYFLCKLNSNRNEISLDRAGAIEYQWVRPESILSIGTIMDLRRLIPVIDFAGLNPPPVPPGLKLAQPLYRSFPPRAGISQTDKQLV